MTDEEKNCRFCLSNKNSDKNPLISPCKCKGSLEFVHLKCLNRWRRMDVQRNGRICSLCLTNYAFLPLFLPERIPQINSIYLYYLNYPGLVLVAYNYIYIVALASNKSVVDQNFLENFYKMSQYVFHFFYFFVFLTEWNVSNKQMYWKQLKTLWTPFLFALHIFFMTLLQKDIYILGPIVSFYMGIYWKTHLRILETINLQLNHLEQE